MRADESKTRQDIYQRRNESNWFNEPDFKKSVVESRQKLSVGEEKGTTRLKMMNKNEASKGRAGQVEKRSWMHGGGGTLSVSMALTQ